MVQHPKLPTPPQKHTPSKTIAKSVTKFCGINTSSITNVRLQKIKQPEIPENLVTEKPTPAYQGIVTTDKSPYLSLHKCNAGIGGAHPVMVGLTNGSAIQLTPCRLTGPYGD